MGALCCGWLLFRGKMHDEQDSMPGDSSGKSPVGQPLVEDAGCPPGRLQARRKQRSRLRSAGPVGQQLVRRGPWMRLSIFDVAAQPWPVLFPGITLIRSPLSMRQCPLGGTRPESVGGCRSYLSSWQPHLTSLWHQRSPLSQSGV